MTSRTESLSKGSNVQKPMGFCTFERLKVKKPSGFFTSDLYQSTLRGRSILRSEGFVETKRSFVQYDWHNQSYYKSQIFYQIIIKTSNRAVGPHFVASGPSDLSEGPAAK